MTENHWGGQGIKHVQIFFFLTFESNLGLIKKAN